MAGTAERGVVWCHGWGFGAADLQPLAAALGLERNVFLDFGFLEAPPHLAPDHLAPDHLAPDHLAPDHLAPDRPAPPGGWVGIGHSFGFIHLLRLDVPWRALVAVGGFPRFVRGPDFPLGTDRRVLARMQARLEAEPDATLADFRALCAAGPPESPPDWPRLQAGLADLAACDERARLAGLDIPVLALFAADDAVIAPAMAQAFPGPVARLAQGGHGLPWTAPEASAQAIRAFLDGVR